MASTASGMMGGTDPSVPPRDWYAFIVADSVDCSRPGLYEWHIEGLGRYIGKYTRISRPRREYWLNVARLLSGRPYRRNKPDRFRRIHCELAEAFKADRRVTLTILENPPSDELNRRERELIRERGTLNGPARVAAGPS